MWSFLNTMQIIEFMPYCQINPPQIVIYVLDKFSISAFDLLPKNDIFNLVIDETAIESNEQESYLPNFSELGQPSRNFVINSLEVLASIGIILGSYIVYKSLNYFYKKKTLYFTRKLRAYKFRVILRFLLEAYLPILVSIYITFASANQLKTGFDKFSLFMCIVFSIILAVFTLFTLTFLFRRRKSIRFADEGYIEKYKTFFKEIRLEDPWAVQAYSFFILRRIVYATVIVFVYKYPYVQVSLFVLTIV